MLFSKKHEKQFTIMKTNTFEQEQKTIQVHTFEPHEDCFPFAIVEQKTISPNGIEAEVYEIALGQQKVDEKSYYCIEQAMDVIKSKPYNLIMALICETITVKDKWEQEQIEFLKTKNNENNE